MKTRLSGEDCGVNFTHERRFLARRAFTKVELIVVIVVMALLVAMVLPVLAKAKAKAKRIHCVGRLKNIGLAHRIFATDNGDLFPWERSRANTNALTNFPVISHLAPGEQVVRIFQSLSNELSTPKIIVCPADSDRREASSWVALTTNNISYFLGLSAEETLPQTFLAGDRNMTVNGQRVFGKVDLVVKETNAPAVGWDNTIHRGRGTAAMGDGSVQQLSSARLREQLRNTGVTTNTFVFP